MGSLRDREVACSASKRQGSNSNSVSGRQCHLIHLTILRRFAWLSLAYMCTKGGLKPQFHFISHTILLDLMTGSLSYDPKLNIFCVNTRTDNNTCTTAVWTHGCPREQEPLIKATTFFSYSDERARIKAAYLMKKNSSDKKNIGPAMFFLSSSLFFKK